MWILVVLVDSGGVMGAPRSLDSGAFWWIVMRWGPCGFWILVILVDSGVMGALWSLHSSGLW